LDSLVVSPPISTVMPLILFATVVSPPAKGHKKAPACQQVPSVY